MKRNPGDFIDHHIHEAKQNADGRQLPSLIFALGDYAALAAAGILAVYIRNCIMTYSTFQVSQAYLFLWLPLVFMFFNFYGGLYGRRMLIYRMVERLFFACWKARCWALSSCSLLRYQGRCPAFLWFSTPSLPLR